MTKYAPAAGGRRDGFAGLLLPCMQARSSRGDHEPEQVQAHHQAAQRWDLRRGGVSIVTCRYLSPPFVILIRNEAAQRRALRRGGVFTVTYRYLCYFMLLVGAGRVVAFRYWPSSPDRPLFVTCRYSPSSSLHTVAGEPCNRYLSLLALLIVATRCWRVVQPSLPPTAYRANYHATNRY